MFLDARTSSASQPSYKNSYLLDKFEEKIVNILKTAEEPQTALQISKAVGYNVKRTTSILLRIQNLNFIMTTNTSKPLLWAVNCCEIESEMEINHSQIPQKPPAPHTLLSSFSNPIQTLPPLLNQTTRQFPLLAVPILPVVQTSQVSPTELIKTDNSGQNIMEKDRNAIQMGRPKPPHELISSYTGRPDSQVSNHLPLVRQNIQPPKLIRRLMDLEFLPPAKRVKTDKIDMSKFSMNPVSLLNTLCQKKSIPLSFRFEYNNTNTQSIHFDICATVGFKTYTAKASSKKAAKYDVCDIALKDMLLEGT